MHNPARFALYLIVIILLVVLVVWSFLVGMIYGQSNAKSRDDANQATNTASPVTPSGALTMTATVDNFANGQLKISHEAYFTGPTQPAPAGTRTVLVDDQTGISIQIASTTRTGLEKQADFLASLSAATNGTAPPAVKTVPNTAGTTTDLQPGAKIKITIDKVGDQEIARTITVIK